ncbi:hypothetical protein DFH06DRAFT_1127333 [Mycena polygramma]|nr:hypothetical protein DFH06DRAFT_1127333 [Mycena polygramma]
MDPWPSNANEDSREIDGDAPRMARNRPKSRPKAGRQKLQKRCFSPVRRYCFAFARRLPEARRFLCTNTPHPAAQPATGNMTAASAPAAAPVDVGAPVFGFHTKGPWVAGNLYVVVPTGDLLPITEEEVPAGETGPNWYCITKGHYVGVTPSNPLALNATLGVSGSAMKGYGTQALALAAFNQLLGYRMVAVIP